MTTLLLQALALVFAFVLPGALVILPLDTGWPRPVQLAVATGLAMLVVPTLAFAGAWILGTSVTPWLVVGVAGAVNIIAGAVWVLRRLRRTRTP